MSDSIICERAFEFARRILKLSERLATRGFAGRHIAGQLVKCGTSIGANAEESQEAQTKPDFITKLAVSRKEAKETGYWLRLAIASEVASAQEVEWELDESKQLLKMIKSAIITAQSSPHRGGIFPSFSL
jgi:four helix bundle protein